MAGQGASARSGTDPTGTGTAGQGASARSEVDPTGTRTAGQGASARSGTDPKRTRTTGQRRKCKVRSQQADRCSGQHANYLHPARAGDRGSESLQVLSESGVVATARARTGYGKWGRLLTVADSTSVFPVLALSRAQARWEDHLTALTPWEHRSGIHFKRDDYFAPLGYGGPNGSKLRQLIWYIDRYRAGKSYILTGASVQSPQLSMSAIVGRHYGLDVFQVVYSTPQTVLRHDNPRIAYGFGADFVYAKCPYNPELQRLVDAHRSEQSLVVEYGSTMPINRFDRDAVAAFHAIGGRQLDNLPSGMKRLIMPAGSCNTLTSVLAALTQDSRGLDELFTVGIGPDKLGYVRARLSYIGVDLRKLQVRWRHYSLHDEGYCTYSEKFHGEQYEGIQFHPTYEAKVWRWLRHAAPIKPDGATGFWIIGSSPSAAVAAPYYTRKAW